MRYCVANMPGAVPRTSTYALNNATPGGLLAIADQCWQQTLRDDEHLQQGRNVYQGKLTYKAVAEQLGYDYTPVASFL